MNKIIKVASVLLGCCLMAVMPLAAQNAASAQMYTIHEDVVHPYMVKQYEEASKNLVNLFKKHNFQGLEAVAASSDDFTYIYITPIESLADLDKIEQQWGELSKMEGEEGMEKVFAGFEDSYSSHRDYVVTFRPDLSHNPSWSSSTEDIMNYRVWEIFNVVPGKEAEMGQIVRKWKALYEKHNIAEGFSIYYGGFGSDVPLLIVANAAKSPVTYAQSMERIINTLGQEGEDLWYETMAVTQKLQVKSGWMRPDLSYQPAVAASGN